MAIAQQLVRRCALRTRLNGGTVAVRFVAQAVQGNERQNAADPRTGEIDCACAHLFGASTRLPTDLRLEHVEELYGLVVPRIDVLFFDGTNIQRFEQIFLNQNLVKGY